MIVIKYDQLNGPLFEALQDVKSAPMPFKTSYTLGKIIQKIDKAMIEARKEHADLLKGFVELDEKGDMKPWEEQATDPNGAPMLDKENKPVVQKHPFKFVSPEKKKEYEEALQKFLATEGKIDYHPLSINSFGNTELTPEAVIALDPILTTSNLQLAAANSI